MHLKKRQFFWQKGTFKNFQHFDRTSIVSHGYPIAFRCSYFGRSPLLLALPLPLLPQSFYVFHPCNLHQYSNVATAQTHGKRFCLIELGEMSFTVCENKISSLIGTVKGRTLYCVIRTADFFDLFLVGYIEERLW